MFLTPAGVPLQPISQTDNGSKWEICSSWVKKTFVIPGLGPPKLKIAAFENMMMGGVSTCFRQDEA